MIIHLPQDVESSIRAAVHSGYFASVEDAMTKAARLLLQELKQAQQAAKPINRDARPDLVLGSMREAAGELDEIVADAVNRRLEEPNSQELQRRLFEAGLLSEVKPPITDLAPYQNRHAIPIQGEPLSETVIRERR